jgi:hypothetical protein
MNNLTDEICQAAVKENPLALEYVKDQSEGNGLMLEYVRGANGRDMLISSQK